MPDRPQHQLVEGPQPSEHRVRLVDDGTMDTVFACSCGELLRYVEGDFERSQVDGSLLDPEQAEKDAQEEHLDMLSH